MAGFSSDGDSRLLNAMRHNTRFDSWMENNEWFGDSTKNICYFQDIIHVLTKLRNRLLKLTTNVLIGKKVASVSHLKILLNSVSKADHGLIYSDICPDDRQNYSSLDKIMASKVRESLEKYVVDSEGTIEYIRICHDISSGFYDDALPPIDRLFRILRSTFFLRACRLSIIKKSESMTDINVSNNFITQNAYACIELNALNMVILMRKFRDESLCKYFIPSRCTSQTCEETFRKFRSMGTMNYTKINFSLLELMHMVGRVELANDIMYNKLADNRIQFPRSCLNKSKLNEFDLPSDSNIKLCIEEALEQAVRDAKKFGIHVQPNEINVCELRGLSVDLTNESIVKNKNELCKSRSKSIGRLNSSTSHEEQLDEKSCFVNVAAKSGAKKIRKSSLIGVLTESKAKLSSDRLKRVRGVSQQRTVSRRLEFVDVSPKAQVIFIKEEIGIGDWCVFQKPHGTSITEFLIGNILSFKYESGKTKKDAEYVLDFAPIVRDSDSRQLSVFAQWYCLDEKGNIDHYDGPNCFYLKISQYVITLSCIAIEKISDKISLAQKHLDLIRPELAWFIQNKEFDADDQRNKNVKKSTKDAI